MTEVPTDNAQVFNKSGSYATVTVLNQTNEDRGWTQLPR